MSTCDLNSIIEIFSASTLFIDMKKCSHWVCKNIRISKGF